MSAPYTPLKLDVSDPDYIDVYALKRQKVPLQPGYSAMHWMSAQKRIVRPVRRKIRMDEIARHNKADDMWLVIRGRVYNITPYIPYHPGGLEPLLRGAGRDATKLFQQIHGYLNIDALVEACYIGDVEG